MLEAVTRLLRPWFAALCAVCALAPGLVSAHPAADDAPAPRGPCDLTRVVQGSALLRQEGRAEDAAAALDAHDARCPRAACAAWVRERALVLDAQGQRPAAVRWLLDHPAARAQDPGLGPLAAAWLLDDGQPGRGLDLLGPARAAESLELTLLRVRLLRAAGRPGQALARVHAARARLGPVPALVEAEHDLRLLRGDYAGARAALPDAPGGTWAAAQREVERAALWLRQGDRAQARAALARAAAHLAAARAGAPAARIDADRRELLRALGGA